MLRLLLVLLALLLVGCADKTLSDLEIYVAEVKARSPGPIPPIPEIRQAESFTYVPAARRDPFKPEVESEERDPGPGPGPGPDPSCQQREELENYSLDTMRMVGTLAQHEDVWGLVQTNDGTIHRVREGNCMGRNHGLIVRINEDAIELTEFVPTDTGGWLERQQLVDLSGE